MLIQFFLGGLLIILTVIIHATSLSVILSTIEKIAPLCTRLKRRFYAVFLMVLTVLMVFFVHIIEIWLWAGFYLLIDALPDFETALYFSTTSFTTVGYGDIVLSDKWRLLSSFQAANGFMLFGWSTAFIYEVMSKLYKDENIGKTDA